MPKRLPALLLLSLAGACSAPLAAQEPPPDNLGIQGRLALPGGNLPDATGGRAPGLGAGLEAELHFYEMENLCARVVMGLDHWRQSGGSGNRSVADYLVGGEAVYFLRPDFKGAYLVGGLELTTWALGSNAQDTGIPYRVVHMAYTGGFGYRINPHVDVELQITMARVNPTFTANTTRLAVTYWF